MLLFFQFPFVLIQSLTCQLLFLFFISLYFKFHQVHKYSSLYIKTNNMNFISCFFI
ncbi:hypothetical protein C1645_774860 [Glomus cerebriforme]|uniref:Uncharacterized protein n=1 Tax=Glomus cerebriforme TaxID=658196 RepID=A0A397SXD4_9GLOM|nr:hypothetical protein C1645_774860 [Glomus cerebriforme]